MNLSARAHAALLGSMFFAAALTAHAQKREHVEIALGDGRSLTGVLYAPATQAPSPAVMVLHTKNVDDRIERFDEEYAAALAKDGFVALAANYVHPSYGGRYWNPLITADMARWAQYLRSRPESKDMPIGTVGFSLGSRGLLLAAQRPDVKAVVVYYGTFDARKEKGIKMGPGAVVPMQVADQVNAAVLLFHGDADDEIRISSAREMKAALEAAGKKVSLVEYRGAYHRFDRGPVSGMRGDVTREGYTYRRDARAARDAYSRTVAWLKEHLR